MWNLRRLEPAGENQFRLGLDYKMDQADLTVRHEAEYTVLDLRGGQAAAAPGAPALPFLTVRVAVPEGARVAGVSVVDAQREPLEGTHVVMPGQFPRLADLRSDSRDLAQRYADFLQNRTIRPQAEAPAFVAPDPALYRQAELLPAETAVAAGEQKVGPYRVLAIRVNPVQYVPAKGALVVSRSLSLAVDLIRPEKRTPQRQRFGREQLEMYYEIAAGLVVNPDWLTRPEGFKAPGGKYPYLVLTTSAMRSEFDRLAEWKTSCGLPARVVTKEEILNKVYGDFTLAHGVAARDTQEILRNFLQWAYRAWQVCYLVIGGDTEAIPVRQVAALSHYNWYQKMPGTAPDENRSCYDPVKKQANIRMKDVVAAATPLLAITSGKRVPYNPSASGASLGWYYATDDTFSAQSPTPTWYVVVKGPAGTVNDATGFYRIDPAYSIPTDLYYASLESPRYARAGRHDWDALNNGLYGYYNETGEPSGIDFTFNLCTGRLPCATQPEAKVVVDKLIRYEKYDGISNLATRRALFAADYWAGPTVVWPDAAAENRYALADPTTCRITLKETPGVNVDLIADDGAGVYRLIPHQFGATPANPGWYFAAGPATLAPSEISLLGITLRIPTPYIVVRGPAGTLSPNAYWVDNAGPDGALVEKEQARALFRAQAPQVDLHTRLYRDFASTPAASPGEAVTTGVLDTASLQDAWSDGAAFVSLSGHGWPGGCCTVSTTQADGVTNGMNLPVVVADSCSTNNFEENDAFSERLLLNPAGGAIAYLGNTRFSWIGMGDDVERLFWDALFAGGTATSLGHGFASRFLALSSDSGWAVLWKWIILAQNLLGDPAMRPWAGVPRRLSLRVPSRATPVSAIAVAVTDEADHPVPFARVCAYQRGRLMQVGYTDSTGRCGLSLAGASRGTVAVTATKAGCVPLQQAVTLI
jgi:hypothetical protein